MCKSLAKFCRIRTAVQAATTGGDCRPLSSCLTSWSSSIFTYQLCTTTSSILQSLQRPLTLRDQHRIQLQDSRSSSSSLVS